MNPRTDNPIDAIADKSGDRSALLDSFGFDRSDDLWLESLRAADRPPTLGALGEYELIGEIGRGGQGVVYDARQPGTRRRIALKRLWAGSLASTAMRARFEREIEASSLLSHPNIVRVYGAEVIDEQHVLAMEWIDGVPIDAWARGGASPSNEQHSEKDRQSLGSRDGPSVRRSLRQILEAFKSVCDAVNHAHQHGVLHRDLKPSNILMDAADQPHVLDFGLAKFSDERSIQGSDPATLTHASGFLGTPAYSSPEQVSGGAADVDARSDVYSLGVILYQMLTGSLPYGEARSLVEVFDAIRSEDPKKPSARCAGLDGEIDAIVLKALEKSPQRRYQSVDALGADVRRYLHHETVLAHPPTAAYQARKFVVRHRVMVAALAAVFLAPALGLAATISALMRLRASQVETQAARTSAEQINDFLNEMVSTADPAVVRAYDVPVNTMLDEAVKRLDAGALSNQPDAESTVRSTISRSYQSLGLFPQARAQAQTALDRCRLVKPADELKAAELALRYAEALYTDEEFDQAEPLIQSALETRRRLLGVNHADTCRAELTLTSMLVRNGEGLRARELLCDLLPRAIQASGGVDNDLVIDVKSGLGYAKGCNNDWREGIRLYQEVLEAQRRLYGDEHDKIARTLINMGAILSNHNDRERAQQLLREALDMRLRLYGEDHPAVATAHFNLANVLVHSDLNEAEQHYRRALDIQERRLSPGHYRTEWTRAALGRALAILGQYEESEHQLRRAIDELMDKPGSFAGRSVNARRYLAECLIRQKRFEEAEIVLTEAWKDATTRLAEYHQAASVIIANIALYESWGKPEQAALWRERKKTQNAEESQD